PPPYPRRSGGPSRGLMVGGAALLGFIVVVVAVILLTRGSDSGASRVAGPTNTAPPTSSTGGTRREPSPPMTTPLAATAAQVEAMLQLSKTARLSVQDAVGRVGSCTLSPTGGQRAMETAIATRRRVLDQMSSVGLESLPNGSRLRAELGGALTTSIE